MRSGRIQVTATGKYLPGSIEKYKPHSIDKAFNKNDCLSEGVNHE